MRARSLTGDGDEGQQHAPPPVVGQLRNLPAVVEGHLPQSVVPITLSGRPAACSPKSLRASLDSCQAVHICDSTKSPKTCCSLCKKDLVLHKLSVSGCRAFDECRRESPGGGGGGGGPHSHGCRGS